MDYRLLICVNLLIINAFFCYGQVERDIILTPKEALQVSGRSIYYKPSSEEEDTNSTDHDHRVPWEQTLKHVTYLTLNNQINDPSNISELTSYKKFLKSPYIKSNEYIPKFGDIITLARGRVEKVSEDQFQFIEGQCVKCSTKSSKIVAFWIVQKIRHRDPDRNFRYEIKFSVNPNIVDKSDAKRDIRKSTLKTFILKDDDYPNSFINFERHVIQRRYDTKFDDIFSQTSYIENGYPVARFNRLQLSDLNIGEYIPGLEMRTSYKAIPTSSYQVKFLKPTYLENGIKILEDDLKRPPITSSHLHHHYYLTRNKFPGSHVPKYPENFYPNAGSVVKIEDDGFKPMIMTYDQTPSPVANQIPIPPNLQNRPQITQYAIPVEKSNVKHKVPFYYVQSHQTQETPVETYQVMQPIRVLSSYDVTSTRHPETTKPFIGSPQYDNIYYSDPDPLYMKDESNVESGSTKSQESPNYYEVNYTPNTIDVSLTVPSESQDESDTTTENQISINPVYKPDSINAQLPPPDRGQDLRVPYVETSIVTEKSASPVVIITPKPLIDKTIKDQVQTKSDRQEVAVSTTRRSTIVRGRHTTTSTERPVLKWKAKRTKTSKATTVPDSSKSSRKSSSSRNFRSKFEFERVPVNVTERVITVTPENYQKIERKESVSKSVSVKIGNQTEFDPSTISIPNVELYPASLEKIDTNASNIKLYKASDRMDRGRTTFDDSELTKSIVDHVRSLGN